MPYDRNTIRNIDQAYEEAKLGAMEGGLRWGLAGTFVFGVAQYTWPIYRNLTVPFKSFLLMSVIITGGMVNADSRMQRAEKKIRAEQQTVRRQAFEDEIDRSYDNMERRAAAKRQANQANS